MLTNRWLRLLVIATIFMFVFQLESRLLAYVYLFHEGLLLIQAMLLGGGLLLLVREVLPERAVNMLEQYTPIAIAVAFLLQQLLFYSLNSFAVDFVALSILFAFIFNEIAALIDLKSNRFYALELLGSFVGVGLYALAVIFFLEEWLLIATAITLLAYAVLTFAAKHKTVLLGLVAVGVMVFTLTLQNNSLPGLLHCSVSGTSYGYKSVCLDDISGQEPDASFSHLKGRSDIYIRENAHLREFLEVKNTGYRVSAANPEADRDEPWFELLEHRIPKLAYPDDATVLSVGAGAGSYVQAMYAYVENPNITAVEIDHTVDDIYAAGQFEAFLPPADSYDIVYDEGRRYMTLNDDTYDVITIAIEGINSSLPKYVDVRTGLLYSQQGMETYLSRLNPGGYLVLEQYYPSLEAGPEMGTKFLQTLHNATDVDIATFRENLYLYSWAFHNQPNAQRFLAGIYKPDGFTEEDLRVLEEWIVAMQTTDLGGGVNPHNITVVHSPSTASLSATFTPYFDEAERTALAEVANIAPTTDDRPFRHLVTTLPFPPLSYSIFLVAFAGLFVLLSHVLKISAQPRMKLLLTSFTFGLLTFGLQYLLFYKTAAFIHTSLIFFSIFLLFPLGFGAIGGYYAHHLKPAYDWLLIGVWLVLAYAIAAIDIFATHRVVVIALIAGLFTITGVLFPRLLELSSNIAERRAIYAINTVAGGFALVLMVTLHATIGWSMTFTLTTIAIAGSFIALRWLRS